MNAVILIVDDDARARSGLRKHLSSDGHEVHCASGPDSGLGQFDRVLPDLVLADLGGPRLDGLSFIMAVRERDGAVPILALASAGSVEAAVAAMKCGASDFLQKPLEPEILAERVERALERVALRKEVLQFRPEIRGSGEDSDVLLGRSAQLRAIYRTIKRLSRSASTTVLIEGESGTGKELVARAIHWTSARRAKPFVAVNCAALTESLLEAELFGYEKGAFTGAAAQGKAGLFEAADGGTIFLDEIGEMGFELQAKLLRVLQDKRFLRVGGTRNIAVDVRVVASTNRNLEERVREGTFRHDLFFRLKVVTIRAPTLRDRKEDILPLAKYFLEKFNRQFRGRIAGFSPEAEKLLLAYPWPGNVRELKNVVESCVILENGDHISARNLRLESACLLTLPRRSAAFVPATPASRSRPRCADVVADEGDEMALSAVERRHILRVLNETMWQRGQAASILGIHRTTLANKIREYGLANA